MGVLENARALAHRMIAQYGMTVLLTRVTPGTYNAATATRTADVETVVGVMAVEQAYTPLLGLGLGRSVETNTTIAADARSFLIAGADAPFPPAPGMTITKPDGSVWTITSVKVDAPNGVPILYTCAASGR